MYRLKFYKHAAGYYKKLDQKTQRRINIAMDEIIENPFEGTHIKKLKGRLEDKYCYSLGRLRVIYYLDENNKIIYVEAIGPRGDIYK
jgi:mRNA interferase RelE/StbE